MDKTTRKKIAQAIIRRAIIENGLQKLSGYHVKVANIRLYKKPLKVVADVIIINYQDDEKQRLNGLAYDWYELDVK